MPQLWLTYDELSDQLGCDPVQARSTSVAAGWTRKHSHDGLTRVLMPPLMMLAYFRHEVLRDLAADAQTDAMVAALRGQRPAAASGTVPRAVRGVA